MSIETVAVRMGFRPDQALALERACIRFGIDTALRVAHFLGQVAHESREGLYMEEIASGAAYEGRKDLGNTQPGDGRRFKGRGLIQLTGRHNYREYSRSVYGDDRAVHSPEMVSELPDAAMAAGWFWDIKGLNVVADTDNVRSVTRIVNGGYNGLADREDTTAKAKRIYAELVQ